MIPFLSKTGTPKLLGVISLLLCISVSAQNFGKGKIIDSVEVQGANKESYALYIPKSLSEKLPAPIIFVFDPAARGAVGINPFIDVSEEHGHIIVCSNNSKNGSYEKNFAVAENLFAAVFSTLNINTEQMYLAGFSGGSRLATAIACLSDNFKGVVGCGAGFSGVHAHTPTFQDFIYVGLCGNEDTNYREMLENQSFLQKFNFNNALITFDGNHQWPPRKEINRAFRWLLLEENKGAMDKEMILENFHKDFNDTKAYLASDKILLAAENYNRLLQSYNTILPLDSVHNQYTTLVLSKPYKKEKKALSSALATEADLTGKLVTRLKSDLKNPEKAKLDWWTKEIAKLNAIKSKKGVQFRKMVARIKFNLFGIIYERHSLGKPTDAEFALGKDIRQIIYPR